MSYVGRRDPFLTPSGAIRVDACAARDDFGSQSSPPTFDAAVLPMPSWRIIRENFVPAGATCRGVARLVTLAEWFPGRSGGLLVLTRSWAGPSRWPCVVPPTPTV